MQVHGGADLVSGDPGPDPEPFADVVAVTEELKALPGVAILEDEGEGGGVRSDHGGLGGVG
jgi:hypothetical protein